VSKRLNLAVAFLVTLGCFFYSELRGEAIRQAERNFDRTCLQPATDPLPPLPTLPPQLTQPPQPTQNPVTWELPSPYAQVSWPGIHRDSRNSNCLPFDTTDQLKPKWHALKDECSAVLTALVTGSEGNLYFTTGKEVTYGNLHAFDREGNELWRSYLLDFGALASSPLVDSEGDLYLGDMDEFFGFHADGTLKWRCVDIKGPFGSSVFSREGYIIAINKDGLVYALDPRDGKMAAAPLELPGDLPPAGSRELSPPAGLWKGMLADKIISGLFNGFYGHQYKIVNTPAVNPANGRIYIPGTIKRPQSLALNSSAVEGVFYGIDLIHSCPGMPLELTLAFQTRMSADSGSSPAVSPDGSHIYVLGGAGNLHAFDKDGNNVWSLLADSLPASPAIGPDGTIYCLASSHLYAVEDRENRGVILWKMNLTDPLLATLPDAPPAGFEKFDHRKITPVVKCNSVVSVSRNHLYLTAAAGYEVRLKDHVLPAFFPIKSFLVAVSPPDRQCNRSQPDICSMVELPDVCGGIITLDSDGTIYCPYASIASSIAYGISQEMDLGLRKPTGGVTALGPVDPQNLTCTQSPMGL
jgi:outer membrane protein assembly factor BamB